MPHKQADSEPARGAGAVKSGKQNTAPSQGKDEAAGANHKSNLWHIYMQSYTPQLVCFCALVTFELDTLREGDMIACGAVKCVTCPACIEYDTAVDSLVSEAPENEPE